MSSPSKPKLGLVPGSWIRALAWVLELGLKEGRQPDDWRTAVRERPEYFWDALMRHYCDSRECTGKEERDKHLDALAANALILKDSLATDEDFDTSAWLKEDLPITRAAKEQEGRELLEKLQRAEKEQLYREGVLERRQKAAQKGVAGPTLYACTCGSLVALKEQKNHSCEAK